MGVNSGCDVLFALAWITGKELSMLERFPEILFADVTECTNKERRGMFIVAGQDGNGNIFNALHCYMPNGKPQTFDWIYAEAMPKLVRTSIIERNRVLMTDGELAMYIPHRENARDPTSPWRNSKHKRCTFHLLTQKWINSVAFNNCKSEEGKLIIQTVHYWLQELVTKVIYHHEYSDTMKLILKYLDEKETKLGSCLFPMK